MRASRCWTRTCRAPPGPHLHGYGDDGDLAVDHDGSECSLRGIAVGRKNWMSYASDNGERTAGVLTSLVATAKRLAIDPFAYLRDLFGRIASHPKARIAELLPDQWGESSRTNCQP